MKNKYVHYSLINLIVLKLEQIIKTHMSFFWLRKKEVEYKVLYSTSASQRKLCIFSGYVDGGIAEYVYYYLEELIKLNLAVIYVSASKISDDDCKKLKKLGIIQIIEKENVMPDFSAWKIALELNDYGQKYESVLLANDSVFGPLYNLNDIVEELQSRNSDFWGMTDSHSIHYHLQSYFLWFNQSVVSSKVWCDFWKNLKIFTDKKVVIYQYETQLTRYFINNGFTSESYIKYIQIEDEILRIDKKYKNCNYLIYLWKELISEKNFPFLKRSIVEYEKIRKMLFHDINHDWKSVIESSTAYRLEYILEYLNNEDKRR